MILREAVETALSIFQSHPDADDEKIKGLLLAAGVPPETAARLVLLMPIALTRLVFFAVGVQFASHYITVDDAGHHTGETPFLEDTVYSQALARCEALLADGEKAEAYRPIAARSAEYQAIIELHLKQGIALKNLAVPPPTLRLPPPAEEAGIGAQTEQSRDASGVLTEVEQPAAAAQKYMETVKAHFHRPFVKARFYEVTLLELNAGSQRSVSFWVIQFRENSNAALIWRDDTGLWRIGDWFPIEGADGALRGVPRYFEDRPAVTSFDEAVLFLESSLPAQQNTAKRSWFTRLWNRGT